MAVHLIDMTQVDGTDLSGVNAALSREADKPGRKPLKAELLVKRAIELRDLGQHSEALTEFERAVQLDPDNANHRFHFGTSLGLEGDYERAREQLLKAIELSPSWDYPFCEISLHMAKQGNVGGALLYLRTRAAEFDGNSYQYHWTEGRLLHGLDRYVEALKSLERSVEIKPESAEAWNMASRVARLLLDRAKGLRYAKRAMHFGNRESYDRYFPGE
jgi:tetratricopeptide (TPR) repeat protein